VAASQAGTRSRLDGAVLPLATLFGAGFFPIAPATFASLLVTAAYALIGPGPGAASTAGVLGAAAVLFLAGVFICSRGERAFGHDGSPIVFDELVGQLITLAGAPARWPVLLAGFILFRAADILKPPPAGAAERLGGGLGVMADDAVAGIYAFLALRALLALGL
jgi:phosphatidylglycerophosphatase A